MIYPFIFLTVCDTPECYCSVFFVKDAKYSESGDLWIRCYCPVCEVEFWENKDVIEGIPF